MDIAKGGLLAGKAHLVTSFVSQYQCGGIDLLDLHGTLNTLNCLLEFLGSELCFINNITMCAKIHIICYYSK